LQTEFVKLQEWVRETGTRIVVVFEGRVLRQILVQPRRRREGDGMVPDGEQLRRFKPRLNVMSPLVSTIGYVDVGHPKAELPERPVSSGS
jgi:hypothetical protein